MAEIKAERVLAIANAARISIPADAAARVAAALAPAVRRMSEADLKLDLETEPSTFAAIQLREASR